MGELRWVLPGKLHLPPTRPEGADDYKYARQESEFGASVGDMPAIEVIAGAGEQMVIFNGVTRATRAYRYHPDQRVLVEVTDILPGQDMSRYPTVEEVQT